MDLDLDKFPFSNIFSGKAMKILNFMLIILMVLLSSGVCRANVYGYVDRNGVYHFTNIVPTDKKYRTVVYSVRRPGDARNSLQSRPLSGQHKSELITLAKSYIGSPYKLGGDQYTGIDCSGFVKQVFSPFGVRLPRTAREQFQAGARIERDELAPGDLIFFNTRKTGDASHVGIFLGEDKFIHATTRNGGRVRIDSLADAYYGRTFMGASRLIR